MKKILFLIFLTFCSKNNKNIDFKNKDINEELAIALMNNNLGKAIALINQGANINYIYNNKSILDLSIENKNLNVLKLLLEKNLEINDENIVKIFDLSLYNFDLKILDLIRKNYSLNQESIGKHKYFLFLYYTSDSEELKDFLKKNDTNLLEIQNEVGRNLFISIICTKLEAFKILVEEYNFKINYISDNELPPLIFFSIFSGNKKLIKFVIEKGANVNERYKGLTVLMLISEFNSKSLVELLIRKGANVNDKYEEDGRTPLIIASQNGNEKVVEALIKNQAFINDKDNDGSTALILACQNRYEEVIKLLIEKGANINDANNIGKTPLMLASENGNIETVRLLLEKNVNINDKENNGFTALMLASQNGYFEIIELLISKGADLSCKDSKGLTSLMIASRGNHKKAVKSLIKNSASIDEKDKDGKTALMIASQGNHKKAVKSLIKNGANIDEKDKDGKTALILALQSGNIGLVNILAQEGANLVYKDKDGLTPLMLASERGYIGLVDLLIKKGVNVNDKNKDGFTALMFASKYKNIKTLELLINGGANFDEKNKDGKTALILACQNGCKEVIELLIDKGASVNFRIGSTWISRGKSALTIAYENDFKEIVDLLISKGANFEIFENIFLEDILIKNIQRKDVNNCLLMVNNHNNRINYKYKDNEGNNFLHHIINLYYNLYSGSSILFDESSLESFLDYDFIKLLEIVLKKGCNINLPNNNGETPLCLALTQESIDPEFLVYLLERGARLKSPDYVKCKLLLDILMPYKELLNKLVLEPITKKILKNLSIDNNDINRLKDVICILKLKMQDFIEEKEMIKYIKNIFLIKYNKLNINIEDIKNLKLEREELINFELEADYILGAAFDLGKDEYQGDVSLENMREAFKYKLINIVQTKAPISIPSINASDEHKSQYVRYLTKKRLRILSLRLSEISENKRKEKLGWVMNHILTNLSCPTGTLEAINYAVNCLIGENKEFGLKEVIEKELMLYRISLLEEVARKHLNNNCVSIMLDESGRELARDKGEYSEHMKAYLIMDLYEELKVTGSYEKDFKYIYDRNLVIREVKKLYKERALNYIIDHIINNKNLSNKVREYLEENIFKGRKLEEEKQTIFHIENFIHDEDLLKLTREALISLLLHFNLLTYSNIFILN